MLKNLFLVCKRTVASRKEENKLEYGFEVLNNGMAINTKNTHYISSHYLRNHTDGMCHVQARSFSHITSNDQEAFFTVSLPHPTRLGRTISYHLEKKRETHNMPDDRCSAQVVAASFLIVNHSQKKIINFSISMATDMQQRCNPLTVKTYD
jgi:hypothetical protein